MLLLLAASASHAALFGGSPTVSGNVNQLIPNLTEGEVFLTKMRVFTCAGSWTDYTVNAWIDPVIGHEQTIAGGDLCNIRFYWGSEMTLKGSNGNGAFEVVYEEAFTSVDLDPTVTTPALTPFDVAYGSAVLAPRLFLSVE